MSKSTIPHYSGWKPRSLRNSKASSETGEKRGAKRSRLGNAKQRAIYIHAKAYKHPEYSTLCVRADKLNRIGA